jgi:hypothetical protein
MRDLMAPDTEPTDEELEAVMRAAHEIALRFARATRRRVGTKTSRSALDSYS